MLHQYLSSNREELIERCRAKVATRNAPRATRLELENGIPQFLDQLIKTLEAEPAAGRSHGNGGVAPAPDCDISSTAMLHGRDLMRQGFTIDQVVHDYGDLCQAVTELAVKDGAPIRVEEFGTLNRCLDNAIAGAVTEFALQRKPADVGIVPVALNEQIGALAHELRNLTHTAMLAVTAIKEGKVGIAGATGAVLDRSLIGLRDLIDRALGEVRDTAGMTARRERIPLAAFIADVSISASLEARTRPCTFIVREVDLGLAVEADRSLLFSAVGNLLQNAFKFTARHTEVSLDARAVGERVLIEVADHCGGLPPGVAGTLFRPFAHKGADATDHGLGLGLSICRRGIEACDGTVRVRDVPGTGCVFTIDLPRHALP